MQPRVGANIREYLPARLLHFAHQLSRKEPPMRIAKPPLMISLSVFLLAVSWSLLGLELPTPTAKAQEPVIGVYDGPSLVYYSMHEGYNLSASDEDGWGWRWNESRRWQSFPPSCLPRHPHPDW